MADGYSFTNPKEGKDGIAWTAGHGLSFYEVRWRGGRVPFVLRFLDAGAIAGQHRAQHAEVHEWEWRDGDCRHVGLVGRHGPVTVSKGA